MLYYAIMGRLIKSEGGSIEMWRTERRFVERTFYGNEWTKTGICIAWPNLTDTRENANANSANVSNGSDASKAAPNDADKEDGEAVAPNAKRRKTDATVTVHSASSKYSLNDFPFIYVGCVAGHIVVVDARTMCAVKKVDSLGGPVWSISATSRVSKPIANAIATNTMLAVGRSNGTIGLFGVEVRSGSPEYWRVLGNLSEKVTAVAWARDGSSLVCGSDAGELVQFDAEACVMKTMASIDASVAAADTNVVWCVRVLRDSTTIVCGDSHGRTQFWDARTGTLICEFTEHESDVLCLEESDDGRVFVSGTDSALVEFVRAGHKWGARLRTRHHSRDVRALCLASTVVDGKRRSELISGALDAQLQFIDLDQEVSDSQILKGVSGGFVPQSHVTLLCSSRRILATRHRDRVDFWRLGDSFSSSLPLAELGHGHQLRVRSLPKLLLRMEMKTCALGAHAISSDGEWFAVTDSESTRVFQLMHIDDAKMEVARDKNVQLPSATSMIFVNHTLVLALPDARIQLYDCGVGGDAQRYRTDMNLNQSVENGRFIRTEPNARVIRMAACDRTDVLAFVDVRNSVQLVNVRTLEAMETVPRVREQVCALDFHPSGSMLVLQCVTNHMYLYSLLDRRFADWTREHSFLLPDTVLSGAHVPLGTTFGGANDNHMYVWSQNRVLRVNVSSASTGTRMDESDRFRAQSCYGDLLLLDRLEEAQGAVSLVAVEQPWKCIEAYMPAAFERKKYGNV